MDFNRAGPTIVWRCGWGRGAGPGGDSGKSLAEKQMFEKLGPRVMERLATRLGAEAAEKWVGRLIPLASSAIGGALNFSFVRTWGRRVQRNLRERHIAARAFTTPPPPFSPPHPALV